MMGISINMKRGLSGLLLVAGFAPAALAHIAVEEFVLNDSQRGRRLECVATFPTTGGKLPLIVFSHGFGADRSAFSPITRHWAEQGYVVIAPSHWDGAGKSKGHDYPLPAGRPSSQIGVIKLENRVRDITYVLDALEQIEAAVPALKQRIDLSRIGVAGHSLGAYTAMLIGGVTADVGDQRQRSFRDPRVRCILPISGQGTGQQGLTDSSWTALTIPMLTITGSQDKGAGGQGPEWKKQPYNLSPPGDKYLVFIDGANHVSFGGAKSDVISAVVKASTLSFWDAYLKDSTVAKTALKSASVLEPWKHAASLSCK